MTISGLLRVSNGTLNVGDDADERIRTIGATMLIEGGEFNISGRFSRPQATDAVNFTMTGGTLTVGTVGNTSTTFAPFNIDQPGASFTMSGGTIVIRSSGGANLGYQNLAGTSDVTGGTIRIGNSSTPAGQTILIVTSVPVWDLVVDGANAPTALLSSNPLTVKNDVTIAGGALDAGSLDISVGGSWTNNVSPSAFAAGTATVAFNGTITQSIGGSSATAFNNITINNPGNAVTLTNSVTVGGDLSVAAGTLDLGSNSANRSSAGGTLSVSNGATLKIGGANTLPSNYATHVIGSTSTIEYAGTANVVAALNSGQSYGNLIISATGATTANSFSVATSLSVLSGGSLAASGGTVTMENGSSIANSGTLTLNGLAIAPSAVVTTSSSFNVTGALAVGSGGNFSPSGGTITMNDGSSIANSGTLAFSSLTIAVGAAVAAANDFTVTGTLTLNNDLAVGSNILTMGPSATTAGTGDVTGNVRRTSFTSGTNYSFGSPFTHVNFASGTLPTSVTFTITKGSTPSGKADAVQRYYDVATVGGSGWTATLRLHYLANELNGNTETDLELWRDAGGNVWQSQGRTGSVNTEDKYAELAGVTSFTSRWTLAAAVRVFYSRADGSWSTAATWSNNGHAGSAASRAPGSAGDSVIVGNNNTVMLDVNVSTFDLVRVNSTGVLNTAAFVLSGSGTFEVNAGATLGIGSPDGITASGASGNIQTSSRSFSKGANYTFSGSSAQSTGSGLPDTVNSLTIAPGPGVAVTLTGSTLLTGDLMVASGTFDLGTNSVDRSSTGGTLTIADGVTLKIGGTNSLPSNYAVHSVSSSSTIAYTGGTQSVAVLNSSQSYGNLIIAGSGTKTLAAPIGIAGDLTISAGTFDLGTQTANRSAPGGALTLASGATLRLAGSSGGITGSNFPANFTTLTLGGTVNYSGSGSQTVAPLTYGDVVFSGSGTKTIGAAMEVSGNMTIASGAQVVVEAGITLPIEGSLYVASSLTNNGTITVGQ